MIDFLAAWVPLILILVVFGLVARRAQARQAQHIEEVNAVNREIVVTNREIVAKLEEIRALIAKNDEVRT